MSIKFGTDGWRAVIAEDFTFQNVERVSRAAAAYWSANIAPKTQKRIVIGYDRRFLSDQFARTAAEIFGQKGFDVILTSAATPTPAVSWAIKAHRAIGGVMITASHNPAAFNGYKLKSHYGGSAQEATCHAVEALLAAPVESQNGHPPQQGSLAIEDLRPAHYRAIRSQLDLKIISASKLRVAHDALYGVGAGCFEELLKGTECRVTTLRGQHDPNFGGIAPEPIERNYGETAAWLNKHPHDLCLVTDGDADRIGAMDGRGGYLTTHHLITLLLYHLVKNRQGRGRMVKALNTTAMVDKMCQSYGLGLLETGVGFKHITPELLTPGALLGAEDSGGIAFAEFLPERDGLLAGMMLLELLSIEKASIRQLLARLENEFGPHHYGRVDSSFPLERRSEMLAFCRNNPPDKLLGSPLADMKTFDGVKLISRDGSWLLLRGSGTEPIIRIYAETSSPEGVQKLLRLGSDLARRSIATPKPAFRAGRLSRRGLRPARSLRPRRFVAAW